MSRHIIELADGSRHIIELPDTQSGQRINAQTVKSESGGNPNAVSPVGARGLMQVMPQTAAAPGYGIKPSNGTPQDDQRVGEQLLQTHINKYGDNAKAWAAYNAGQKWVDRAVQRANAAAPGTQEASWWWQLNNDDRSPANRKQTHDYVVKNMAGISAGQPAPTNKGGLSQNARDFRLKGAAGDPGIIEQFAGGAKHGLDRMAYGLKSMFTDLSPEEKQLLEQGKSFVEDTGAASSVGQLGSEMLATAPIASGVVGVAGKALTKAVPALAKVASYGGRVLNPGLVANAAGQGAISGGLAVPEEGQTRAGNMATGAVIGAALPIAMAGVQKPLSTVWNAVMPTASATQRRAAKVLQRTLSDDDIAAATKNLQNAQPARVPLSTAATADNMKLAELERGARQRATADFATHDQNVGHNVWDAILTDATYDPNGAALLNRFISPQGTPQTAQVLQATSGGGSIPRVTGSVLRKAMGRTENALDPSTIAGLQDTSELLRRHELYKNVTNTGTPRWNHGSIGDAVSTGLAGLHMWGTRALFDSTINRGSKAAEKVLDEALLKPENFLALIAQKQQLGQPLTAAEQSMKQTILGLSRGAAVPGEQ